jgi:hypothetical protein
LFLPNIQQADSGFLTTQPSFLGKVYTQLKVQEKKFEKVVIKREPSQLLTLSAFKTKLSPSPKAQIASKNEIENRLIN